MLARALPALPAVLAAFVSFPAVAQTEQCNWLQSQYVAAARQSGGADAARRLAQAQAAAERMNCNGGGFLFFFGAPPSPGCGAVMADIRRLQASLNRGSFGGWFGSDGPDLPSMRQELRDNGCDVPEASYGRARTICVRTCDGYYFPIAFSSSRSRWKTDAEACQSMYGAAGQAELYTYDPDGDVADAKSLAGKRYGDQPFAFLYRNGYDKACASQLSTGIAALAQRYLGRKLPLIQKSAASVASASAAAPIPQASQPPSEDPETIANRAGQFAPQAVTEQQVATVRHVGPEYYAEVYSLTGPPKPAQSWLWPRAAYAAEAPPQPQSQPQ